MGCNRYCYIAGVSLHEVHALVGCFLVTWLRLDLNVAWPDTIFRIVACAGYNKKILTQEHFLGQILS